MQCGAGEGADFRGDANGVFVGVVGRLAQVDEEGEAAGEDDELAVALVDVEDVDLEGAGNPGAGGTRG